MGDMSKLSVDPKSLAKEAELYANPATEKQRDILRAAEMLFEASGYAETSTASIAKEAGVTEKTLFKHFPTKQDLFRRILFPLILKTLVPFQIKTVLQVIDADHSSFADFFTSLSRDRWRAAQMLGPKIRFVFSEVLRQDRLRKQLVKLARDSVWDDLVQRIKRHQQSGELRSDVSAEDLARFQLAVLVSPALLRSVISPEVKRDDASDLEVTLSMLLDGVRARPSSR